MFIDLILNVGCVFLMMVPGFAARKKGWIDNSSMLSLSRVMLYFCYPCLIFTSITGNYSLAELGGSVVLPIGSAMIMLVGYIVGYCYCRLKGGLGDGQRRSFIFQCTMNNYSFLPIAVIMSMFGSELVAPLILSTLGAELVMWTIGILTISGRKLSVSSLRAMLSPPLLGVYAAMVVLVVFAVCGLDKSLLVSRGEKGFYLYNSLRTLGQGTVPLAMTIAGARMAQLKFEHVHNKLVYVLSGLRLVVIPLAAIGVLSMLDMSAEYRTILLIVAVMPVSLNSLLLNELYGGNRELIAGSVLLSHVLSLVSVPGMLYIFL